MPSVRLVGLLPRATSATVPQDHLPGQLPRKPARELADSTSMKTTRPSWSRIATASLAASLLCACLSSAVPAEQRREELVTRASFDLSCPSSSIRTTCLDHQGDWCAAMGVDACGHRATYVYTAINQAQHEWVMNSVDGTVK